MGHVTYSVGYVTHSTDFIIKSFDQIGIWSTSFTWSLFEHWTSFQGHANLAEMVT